MSSMCLLLCCCYYQQILNLEGKKTINQNLNLCQYLAAVIGAALSWGSFTMFKGSRAWSGT